MGKRGTKPQEKVNLKWSAGFAYAIGLIASDGCLYTDGSHIAFVSKDLSQIENYLKCLGINSKIGITKSGHKKTEAYRVQFSDVSFYSFLYSIGITSQKSKTMQEIVVPKEYFFDFLRGCFDGDGTFYSYFDPRWRASHLFYLEFISASEKHINWLQNCLLLSLQIKGHITNAKNSATFQLKYGKRESLEIIRRMYYNRDVVCLARKRLKITAALEIERLMASSFNVSEIMPR